MCPHDTLYWSVLLFFFHVLLIFSTGFGVEVLKVSPVLIATLSFCLLLIILAAIVVMRLKNSNNRKRNGRQINGQAGDKQVIVHQRSNGQVSTAILETDTDPDLIQVKYGKYHCKYLIIIIFLLNTRYFFNFTNNFDCCHSSRRIYVFIISPVFVLYNNIKILFSLVLNW